MVAERRRVIEPVVEKKRKRASLRKSLLGNPMLCVVMAAVVLCLVASLYVSAYAGCTEKGRNRAQLMSDLRRLRKENEELKTEIEKLKQPEQIELFAKANNMTQCQQTRYLGPIEMPASAQNTASNNIR